MEVHTELGCGFLEAVYRNAMAVELEARRIPFRTEVPFPLGYKERQLPLNYRADLVCFDLSSWKSRRSGGSDRSNTHKPSTT